MSLRRRGGQIKSRLYFYMSHQEVKLAAVHQPTHSSSHSTGHSQVWGRWAGCEHHINSQVLLFFAVLLPLPATITAF